MDRSMPQSDGGILNEETIDKLRAAVLAECGISLNRDDPVFSTVILNKIILDGYMQQVVEALSTIIEASKTEDKTKGSRNQAPQIPQTPQNQPNSTEGISQALHHSRTRLLEELSPIIDEKMGGVRRPTTELLLIGLVVGVVSFTADILFLFYIAPSL